MFGVFRVSRFGVLRSGFDVFGVSRSVFGVSSLGVRGFTVKFSCSRFLVSGV